MKLRNLLIVITVIGIIAGWWYASSATPDAAENVATAPVPAPVDAPKPAAPVAVTPQPAPPPVVTPKLIEMPRAPVAQAPAADQPQTPSPRTDLSTAIPELARLINTQDYETLMQDFMPPDELDDLLTRISNATQQTMTVSALADRMRQNPQTVQTMAAASQFLTYLQTQTPTMNETGDAASYKIPIPVNGQDSINFVKVDGNWYVKGGEAFFR